MAGSSAESATHADSGQSRSESALPRHYTAKEVAESLQIPQAIVMRAAKSGKVDHLYFSSKIIRFTEQQFDELKQHFTVSPKRNSIKSGGS